MNLSTLIKQYFNPANGDVTIDVFDEHNIYNGVSTRRQCKDLGTVLTQYDATNHILSFLIADDGKGVQASLSENAQYKNISEPEALQMCIQDTITDGQGMGFGLYSALRLAQEAGLLYEVRSGSHTMQVKDDVVTTKESEIWQGTIVYMQLRTDIEIDPAKVVAFRTNVAEQYNEAFLNDNELEELW